MADQQPSAAPSEAREVYVVDGVEYTVHPLAMFFPLIEGPPFDEFVEDVHRRGMSQPVLRRGREIIDGRNRLRAALRAGKPVVWKELPVSVHPAAAIMSANIHHRSLTPSQRAVCAKKLRDAAPEVFASPSELLARAKPRSAPPEQPSGNGQTAASTASPRSGKPASPGASAPASDSAAPVDAGSTASSSSAPPSPPAGGGGKPAPAKRGGGRPPSPEHAALGDTAARAGVSTPTQRQAEQVQKDAPELFDAVGAGTVAVRDAYAVRTEKPEIRRAALEAVKSGKPKTLVAAVEDLTGRAPSAQPPSQRRKADPKPRKGASRDAAAGAASLPPMPTVGGTPSSTAPTPGAAPAPAAAAAAAHPDMLVPTYLLAGLRLVLGVIELDPCSNADAQDRIAAAEWYTAEQDGLKQTWKGSAWVFPPLEVTPAFAQKLLGELRAGTVSRAAFLAPFDLAQDWVGKLLAAPSLSAIALERERGVYDIAGSSDNARFPTPMAIYLFGLDAPPEKIVKAMGIWGRVFLNAPGQPA